MQSLFVHNTVINNIDPEYSIDDEDFDESDPHLLQQNEFSDESNFVCPTCGATFSQVMLPKYDTSNLESRGVFCRPIAFYY